MGCYGERLSDGASGQCDCATGVFTKVEEFVLGRIVDGMPAGTTLRLVSSTPMVARPGQPVSAARSHDATQTTAVQSNGRFTFPLKFAKGQAYHLQVLHQPKGARCVVDSNSQLGFVYNDKNVDIKCKSTQAQQKSKKRAASCVCASYRTG